MTGAATAGRGRGRGGPPPSPRQSCVTRVMSPVGAGKTAAGTDSLHVRSSVDDLYRLALGLEATPNFTNNGWTTDTYRGVTRLAAYATPDGKRAAFVRIPAQRATIIILTNDASADARGMADKILDQLIR
jgi:hypothetical protein